MGRGGGGGLKRPLRIVEELAHIRRDLAKRTGCTPAAMLHRGGARHAACCPAARLYCYVAATRKPPHDRPSVCSRSRAHSPAISPCHGSYRTPNGAERVVRCGAVRCACAHTRACVCVHMRVRVCACICAWCVGRTETFSESFLSRNTECSGRFLQEPIPLGRSHMAPVRSASFTCPSAAWLGNAWGGARQRHRTAWACRMASIPCPMPCILRSCPPPIDCTALDARENAAWTRA